MKRLLTLLIAAFTFLILGQASAATLSVTDNSIDSLSSPLICADDSDKKKKKKKKDEEEEPECE